MFVGRKILLTILFCFIAINAFAANSPPQIGTIMPVNGTSLPDEKVIFTTTYTDLDGWNTLKYVQLRIGGRETFEVKFVRSLNMLFFWKDGWGDGVAPGSPAPSDTFENDYIILDCAKSGPPPGQTDPYTLTMEWAITFKDTMLGEAHPIELRARDPKAITPWTQKGTWTVSRLLPPLPSDIPKVLRFQGILRDNTVGGALLDGDFNLAFRLYDVVEGGIPLWQEEHYNVLIENGLLDVELGNDTSFGNLAFDIGYWLGVEVGSDGEMYPRFKLTSVPYAIKMVE
ncbi:MAG: hypothetical protein NG740_02710 [Omnitrophica bacterium]|nr:hypothetical protein [Candidatus Omnitrophota bacterium]